jgi:hypothetical protein
LRLLDLTLLKNIHDNTHTRKSHQHAGTAVADEWKRIPRLGEQVDHHADIEQSF